MFSHQLPKDNYMMLLDYHALVKTNKLLTNELKELNEKYDKSCATLASVQKQLENIQSSQDAEKRVIEEIKDYVNDISILMRDLPRDNSPVRRSIIFCPKVYRRERNRPYSRPSREGYYCRRSPAIRTIGNNYPQYPCQIHDSCIVVNGVHRIYE